VASGLNIMTRENKGGQEKAKKGAGEREEGLKKPFLTFRGDPLQNSQLGYYIQSLLIRFFFSFHNWEKHGRGH